MATTTTTTMAYPPVTPHGGLEKIFDNIYIVEGSYDMGAYSVLMILWYTVEGLSPSYIVLLSCSDGNDDRTDYDDLQEWR